MAQRRPIFWLCLCFVCGIALQPWHSAVWIVTILGSFLLWFARRRIYLQGLRWFWLLLALLLGYSYGEARWQALPQPLPSVFDRQEAELRGMVVGFPKRSGEDWQLELDQLSIEHEGQWLALQGKLRLRIYPTLNAAQETEEQSDSIPVSWQPGDVLQATVKLNRYRQGSNFGDADWQLLFRRRSIIGSASCSVERVQLLSRDDDTGKWNLQLGLYKTRQGVVAAFLGPEQGWMQREWVELLSGLTIGLNDELPEEWDTAFRQAGVVHLLVISGGHFAVMLILARRALRFIPMPLKLEQFLLALTIISYTLLTGAQASILRAGLMALLALFAEILLRRTEWPSLLLLSMALLLLLNPFSLFEAGFQLSYLSVAGICLWTPFFSRWLRWLRLPDFLITGLAATLAAQLAVLPLGIQLFNQISLIAPLSNLLCAALVVPLQLCAVLLLVLTPFGVVATAGIAMISKGLLRLLVAIADVTSSLPGATWNLPSPGWPLVLASYALLLFLTFVPRSFFSWRSKAILCAGFVIALLLPVIHPWLYPLELVMLDVGQGDCLFLRFPNGRTLLIDGGGSPTYTSEVGRRTVVPFLRRQGVQTLDLAIISHPHEDHYQGLVQVVDRFPVRALAGPTLGENKAVPDDLQIWLAALASDRFQTLQTGQRILLDDSVQIEVRSVGDLSQEVSFADVNDASVVLRLEFGDTVLWLTGDAEACVEERLLAESFDEGDKQVILKVAHHGGRGGTGVAWLERLQPLAALISVGATNSYGHPTQDVLERLQGVDSLVFRTDQVGAIRLISDGKAWRVETAIR